IQMVLNALWSIIFFGLHSLGGALVEIIFLWLAVLTTIIAFAKISKLAAWLLVPYILWVSFAGYLNYSIYVLN
ncbi:MAG: TspO/MBR family protein, partial [Patescibacteria group bacterium]